MGASCTRARTSPARATRAIAASRVSRSSAPTEHGRTSRQSMSADNKPCECAATGARANRRRSDADSRRRHRSRSMTSRKPAARCRLGRVEAALVETGSSFNLSGKDLLALQDTKVPDTVIDLIVALSYPDRFVVERTARADVGAFGAALRRSVLRRMGVRLPGVVGLRLLLSALRTVCALLLFPVLFLPAVVPPLLRRWRRHHHRWRRIGRRRQTGQAERSGTGGRWPRLHARPPTRRGARADGSNSG